MNAHRFPAMQRMRSALVRESDDIELIKRCRLCGEYGKNFISIFEKKFYLAEKISRCLPIIVLNKDKLSSYICKVCIHSLNAAYRFITAVVEVDQMMRGETKSHFIEPPRPLDLNDLEQVAQIGPVTCDLCNKRFYDMEEFDFHMECTHFLLWRCESCDKSYNTHEELTKHETEHESNQDEPASDTVNNQSQMIHTEAILDHIDLPINMNNIDATSLKNFQEGTQNMEQDTQENTITPEDNAELNLYAEALEKKSGTQPVIPVHDNSQFTAPPVSNWSFWNQPTTPEPKPVDILYDRVKCRYCPRSYVSRYQLYRHQLDFHQYVRKVLVDGKELFECFECRETFDEQDNLTLHMRSHGNKKPPMKRCRAKERTKCVRCTKCT